MANSYRRLSKHTVEIDGALYSTGNVYMTEFLRFLIALDDLDNMATRREMTLTEIIERAKAALEEREYGARR